MGSANDDLITNAGRHPERFTADLPAKPRRRLAVLSCMDARIDVAALLGLAEGDAHVIRNAGGLATDDALRSLALSQALLDTREVFVIQHTRCGMQGDEEALRERLRAAAGAAPDGPLGAFADVDENVRETVARIRDSGCLVDTTNVRGFVFQVEDGRLREVPA
jgi:carbonic anhydrase